MPILVVEKEARPARVVRILVAERWADGRPVGESLIHGIVPRWRERGHDADTAVDGDPLPGPGEVLLFTGNATFFPRMLRALLATPPDRRPFVAVWHSEPLPPSRASGLPWSWLNEREIAKILLRDARATDPYSNYWSLRSLHRRGALHLIVVTSLFRQEFLAERGIPSHRVPLGYSPAMGRPLHRPRDIDVLFLGELRVHRRQRMLRRIERAGVRVMAAGDWSNPAYWGDARTELVNRARILLNLARTPGELSGLRLILGMANHAVVVSEPIYRPDPYRPDEHFVMAPLDAIPDAVARLLRDDDARARIAAAAYRLITTDVSIERSADRLLELIEQARAGRGAAA